MASRDVLDRLLVERSYSRELRLLACDYAERVLLLVDEDNPDKESLRRALDVARQYANGLKTASDLEECDREIMRIQDTDKQRDIPLVALWAIESVLAENVSLAVEGAALFAFQSFGSKSSEKSWQLAKLQELVEQIFS